MISQVDALHRAYGTKRQKELIHKERACSQVMVRVKGNGTYTLILASPLTKNRTDI